MLYTRRPSILTLALLSALASPAAMAVEFDTGNPDLSIRLDNSVRYNLGQRVEGRDPKIGNTAIADEGTFSFDRGDIVTNRLDLLTELDVVYKGRMGFRVSTSAWYDDAYDGTTRGNPNPPLSQIPSYVGKQFSNTTDRLYAGPSGEVLDAFVFANFEVADVPTRVKAGRHTQYWGESLLLGGNLHSVAYAQNPLDLQKGFATPGVEAKELFRPLNQISGSAQITDTLSLAAQYLFEWEAARYPEGGTYLGPVDFVFNGPNRQFINPTLGFANRSAASEPNQQGEYGLSAKWSPEWLDGTLGFYYRNYADKLPQVLITKVGPNSQSQYTNVYADDISLVGVSLSKNIAGVSVGAEVSYRDNTPLVSQTLGIAPGLPAAGETKGPRGNTYHALINGLGTLPKTDFFDVATWLTELTYAQLDKVTSGANLFQGMGYAPCAGKNKFDGCVTKEFVGLGMSFNPTWFQVFPGVDVSAPVTYAVGLMGNAPTTFGGNEGLGNYTVGVGADLFQKYRVDLKYIDYIGRYKDNGTSVTSQNGLTTFLKDRGFINLTFKATF